MTPYETLFIVHPGQGGKVKELIDRFKKIIEGREGTAFHADEWGLRDLAYPIQKQTKGHYILFQYRSPARAVEDLERNMKLTDGVLRYLTVRLDDEAEIGTRPSPVEPPEEAPKESNEAGAKPEASS